MTTEELSIPSPESITFSLRQKIDELSNALLARHPTMPILLREIHKTILQYPEQVTILAPEEVNKIVEGLKVQTGINFAESASKKGSASQKSSMNKIKALGVGAF